MQNKIEVFTPIRGIAAILIAFSHMYFIWEKIPSLKFLGNGNFSVIIFFMLSGFVLMFRYGDCMKKRLSFKEYRLFLQKRVGKIYVLYMSTQFIFFLYVVGGEVIRKGGGISLFFKYFVQLVYSATMLQSLIPFESVCLILNSPLWYISVLFVFYLLTPFLIRFINRLLKNNTVLKNLLCILAVVLLFMVINEGFGPVTKHLENMFPGEHIVLNLTTPYINIFYFVLGMLLCKFLIVCKERKIDERFSFGPASVLEIGLGLILIFLNFSYADKRINIVAIALWLMVISFQKGALTKFLCGCKSMVFLGNISLHIYMVHFVYTVIYVYVYKMIFPDTTLWFIVLIVSLWTLIIISAFLLYRVQLRINNKRNTENVQNSGL